MKDYKIAVVAVVDHQGQILIGKKVKDINHVLSEDWHIPGGMLQGGETEEQAVVREIKEEAGIEIKINRFLDERIDHDSRFRVRWYLCSPLTHDLKPGDDLEKVKYIPKLKLENHCSLKANSLWPPKVVEYLKNL